MHLSFLPRSLREFFGNRRANVAMMFGLSLVPILLATGAGIDFARGVMVHERMSEALDAAALAVGNATSKPASCPATGGGGAACAALQQVAQTYFDENYDHSQDDSYGKPSAVGMGIAGQAVTLTASLPLKLTLLGLTALDVGTPTVNASSTVVWGQTKLWVALVLDNSGSMSQGDSGTSKMSALQDAITNTGYGLLKTLQSAAATDGDVEVGIVPFTRSINMGSSTYTSSVFIDWGEWEAPPAKPGTAPTLAANYISNVDYSNRGNDVKTIPLAAWGPGDNCPFTDDSNRQMSPYGFYCVSGKSNGAAKVSTIPSSSTYKGYICPGIDSGSSNTDHNDRYYNGCWTSVKNGSNTVKVSGDSYSSCNGFSSSNCSCSGNSSSSSRHCDTQAWTHVWVPNLHSTWSGCVMDRQQKNKQTTLATGSGLRVAATSDYDESNTQPSNNSSWDDTQFPAENPASCPAASVMTLNDNWANLSSDVSNMAANGSTNQAIGVEHGWQMLSTGAPYSTGALPSGTTKVLILFSDGLNTQDRWYGDGSTEGTTQDGYIDSRENATCTAAKADGVTIYAIFIHIGTSGSSTALQNCATDSTKYYDLTSSSQIKTAFGDIAQKITNLRVAQ